MQQLLCFRLQFAEFLGKLSQQFLFKKEKKYQSFFVPKFQSAIVRPKKVAPSHGLSNLSC